MMAPDLSGFSTHLGSLEDDLWDVVVIGAGSAGGMTGYLTAKSGLRTLLVERHSFPRNKVCGGCLNAAGVDLMKRVGLGEIPHRFGLPIDHFCLGMNHRRLNLPLPAGVSIARNVLDTEIVRAAASEGLNFLSETTGSPGPLQPRHREVKLSSNGISRTVRAKSVVVATGLKSINGQEPEFRFRTRISPASRIGTGCTLPGNFSDYSPGRIYMAIGRNGYVGLAATREGLAIACACDPGFLKKCDGPAAAAHDILNQAGFAVPEGIHQVPWSGTLPITRKTRPVAADRLFLIGDAAGYVEPFTGQGMAIAFQSAAKLSPILKLAANSNLYQCENEWSQVYDRHIATRHWPAAFLARLLRQPMITSMAFGLVSCIPRTSRSLIHAINRSTEIPSTS